MNKAPLRRDQESARGEQMLAVGALQDRKNIIRASAVAEARKVVSDYRLMTACSTLSGACS